MNKQFEAVLEGQKKAMEFWSGMSEQMTKAFDQNGKGKKETKAENLLTAWFEQQQNLAKEMMSIKDPQKAFQNAPEQYRKWIALQTEYAEKWMDYYNTNAKNFGGFNFPGLDGNYSPMQFFEEGMKNWKNWMEQGNEYMEGQIMSKLPFNMQPHFSNFMEAYKTMYHYWEPVNRMIQNGIVDQKVIEKYFSQEAYRKLINQVMGFKPVGNASEVIENVNLMFEKYINFLQEEWSDWSSLNENWKEQMDHYTTKGDMPFFQIASDFNNRLRDQLVPFYNVMGKGRQTEVVKTMRDIQFAYVSFILKSAELQTKVYEAGQFVLPDTISDFYKNYQDKKELPDYQSFFNHYINDLEETLLKVLHADEYSQLQSEVSATGAKIKSMMEQIMELTLVDMPFLTKSDGDDIAMENTALRKKVRKLEERLSDLEKSLLLGGKPAAAKAPANAGSAKKKLFERIGTAKSGERDDLKAIKGIGPKLESMLNELGIYSYRQIAKMSEEDYVTIDELLDSFQGRAKRDAWAKQAKELLKEKVA